MGNSSSNAVSQRLDHASKTGVLSLRELKLDEFPPEVLSLKAKLRTLDLSFNKLTVAADSLGLFTNLRTLSLNNNKIVHISLPLGSLARLETLHLQFNLLPSLPGSVADLKALKTLDLSHNQLTSLPPALYSLPHLDYLNLNHNRLQALPEQGLSHLTALELNLSTNSLSCLPAELGMCKRLKVLRVEENCLELAGLPQQLLEESKVSLLCLDGNLFQQKELQELPGYQQYLERFTATRRKVD